MRISGYYHYERPSDYEQETEDMHTILSQKAAKDLLIQYNLTSYTREEVAYLFSDMPGQGKQVAVPRVLAYTNAILNAMYDYLTANILKHNLSFTYAERLRADPDSFKLQGSSHGGPDGLDARTYYLFKYVYGGDRRPALEHTERWEDFGEELLITNAKVV